MVTLPLAKAQNCATENKTPAKKEWERIRAGLRNTSDRFITSAAIA